MQRIILNKDMNFSICGNDIKQANGKGAVVAIGNFDGLHLGHQKLLKRMRDIARENNYRSIVITFEPLPLEYFFDGKGKERLPRLSFLRDKVRFLQNSGYIDEVVLIHFNASIANLNARDFICNILQKKLNVCHAVIGYDFKFGKDGKGSKEDFIANGINITCVPPYQVNNTLISSSMLRELAAQNQLSTIKHYLGRNLQYTARIIYGKQLGRKYNVPTLNLSLGQNKLALHGVYIALVYIEGTVYNAAVNIGKNPTTTNGVEQHHLEAHLLDVTVNAYGKIATVEILEFLRDEEKFTDLDILFKQIHVDVKNTREYFLNFK